MLRGLPHLVVLVMLLCAIAIPAQDRGERRATIVAPAVWLAEFLSEVNEHFAVKQLARTEFYSAGLSEEIDVVWEYHAWRKALVSSLTAMWVTPLWRATACDAVAVIAGSLQELDKNRMATSSASV